MRSLTGIRLTIIIALITLIAVLSGCTPPAGRQCEVLTHLEVPFLACWYNANGWF